MGALTERTVLSLLFRRARRLEIWTHVCFQNALRGNEFPGVRRQREERGWAARRGRDSRSNESASAFWRRRRRLIRGFVLLP